jgi:hypothetical protein
MRFVPIQIMRKKDDVRLVFGEQRGDSFRSFMRHTISVLVENKFGVLTRVAGLFSGRGYNIDTLNVGPPRTRTLPA